MSFHSIQVISEVRDVSNQFLLYNIALDDNVILHSIFLGDFTKIDTKAKTHLI